MKKIITLSLSLLTVALMSTSCNKGCTLTEDVTSGFVVWADNAKTELPVIYPSAGYLTGNFVGDYHIDADHDYASNFEVSFDGGQTKAPVDYSVHNILCYPVTVECDVAVNRTVIVDHDLSLVTYQIDIEECNEGCTEQRVIDNYILVPSFPSTYNVIFDINQ